MNLYDTPSLPWYSFFWSRKRRAVWLADRLREQAEARDKAREKSRQEIDALFASRPLPPLPSTPPRTSRPTQPAQPMETQAHRSLAYRPNPTPYYTPSRRRDDDDGFSPVSAIIGGVVGAAVASSWSSGDSSGSYSGGSSDSGSSGSFD